LLLFCFRLPGDLLLLLLDFLFLSLSLSDDVEDKSSDEEECDFFLDFFFFFALESDESILKDNQIKFSGKYTQKKKISGSTAHQKKSHYHSLLRLQEAWDQA